LQDARVAIAVDHAAGAAVADEFRLVEFVDVAHGGFPKVAAVEVQVPIEVKILVPAQAAEFLGLLAQVALHFGQRFGGIHHRETAARLHLFDLLEHADEFLGLVADEAGVAEAQVTRSQRGQRITEGAACEAERFQKVRQLVIVVDELAGGDAGGGLDAEFGKNFVRMFDLAADIGQAAVFLVLGHLVRINGHDDAAQAVVREVAHVLVGPQRTVGADHRMDARLGRVTNHGAKFLVDERFAANEEEVADVVLDGDVDNILRFLEGDAAALFGIEPVHRETAKIAFGVANVGDGELKVAGAAVVEHFTEQFPGALPRLADGTQKVRCGLTWAGRGCRRLIQSGCAHAITRALLVCFEMAYGATFSLIVQSQAGRARSGVPAKRDARRSEVVWKNYSPVSRCRYMDCKAIFPGPVKRFQKIWPAPPKMPVVRRWKMVCISTVRSL